MREVKLPSGAVLKVAPAPFSDAKKLYQALLREFRDVPVSGKVDVGEFIKNLICAGISSQAVDACLEPCMRRCLYNGAKINDDTFEPIAARDDYMIVIKEVLQENISPFVKSLYAEFRQLLSTIESTQA